MLYVLLYKGVYFINSILQLKVRKLQHISQSLRLVFILPEWEHITSKEGFLVFPASIPHSEWSCIFEI